MKFKIGDKARVKYVRDGSDSTWKVGIIVTIQTLTCGFADFGDPYDCEVVLDNGIHAYPLFEQLEPLVGSWKKIEEIVNWNPTKENVDV